MNLDKLNKILKIFIIILTIVLVIATPISIYNYSNKNKNVKTNNCIKKGNVCTADEIFSGVVVPVEVAKNKSYKFYVIENDENTMTLIMDKNTTKEIEWQFEGINMKGPASAQYEIQKETTNWKNIDIIDNYEYADGGRINFEENCKNGTVPPTYDCSTENYKNRGYLNLTINEGIARLYPNIYSEDETPSTLTVLSSYLARARLITQEEIQKVSNNKGIPKWLVSNLKEKEGYWTMTSSTSKTVGYIGGAIAIAKNNNQASMEMLFSNETDDFTIGVRPVITINKK